MNGRVGASNNINCHFNKNLGIKIIMGIRSIPCAYLQGMCRRIVCALYALHSCLDRGHLGGKDWMRDYECRCVCVMMMMMCVWGRE